MKINFFGQTGWPKIDFGHFKNVHFAKPPPDFYEKSEKSDLDHNALISKKTRKML
jgi:hypothetical protein